MGIITSRNSLSRCKCEGPTRSSTLAEVIAGGVGSAGRIVDKLDLLLARRSLPRARCFRQLGGRGRLDATQCVVMRVAGGVSQTNLGWSGGWGSLMDVVFLITREVVAEGRHRAVSGVS